MRVEAAMSETGEFHQIDHAQAVAATLTQAIGGLFDDPAPGVQPVPFHVAHRWFPEQCEGNREATEGMFISPFFPERAKLGQERPCRTVLGMEMPQLVGDRGRLDKE